MVYYVCVDFIVFMVFKTDFFLDLLWYFELLLSASYEFRRASKTSPHSLLVEQTLEWEDVLDGCTFEPD